MEQIVYRKTLDVHKNGIQFTLQGFETADRMSRKIEISLMASGDTIDFPLEQVVALMYVTTPNATEPSIHECTIKDNVVIYDVLPIVEEGITIMQLKFVGTRVEGANSVLPSPKFAIEVAESSTNDDGAIQSTTFTALEEAIAKSKGVYDARLLRIELDSDCMFRAIYADGTTYVSDVFRETILKGEALLSQSYARGGTGLRVGEDTDNSKYYSNVSKGASEEANKDREEANKILQETRKHGMYTSFSVDFETGEVKYISPCYSFSINKENGNLEASGMTYTPDDTISKVVNEWLSAKSLEIASLEEKADGNASGISLLWDEARSLSTSISTLNMTKAPMTHYHDSDSFVDTWSIEKGGTGATTKEAARSNLGIAAAISEFSMGGVGNSHYHEFKLDNGFKCVIENESVYANFPDSANLNSLYSCIINISTPVFSKIHQVFLTAYHKTKPMWAQITNISASSFEVRLIATSGGDSNPILQYMIIGE